MIPARSLETLNRATLRLYTPELHLGNWVDHAFRFLMAVVSADMVNYGNLDPATGSMQATTTCDGSDWPKAAAGFGAFMKKHPFFCFDPGVNHGKPFFRSDFISARAFRDLDIYSECFRILETMDHAAVHVPTGDGRLAWFALERGGSGDFTEADRALLALAQAHLVNARKLALARRRVRTEFPLDPLTFCRAGFTTRQAEVAYWLTEGKTNAEIALLMKVQVQTIKGYLSVLFNRTGVGNRLALTLELLELARTVLPAKKSFTHVPVRSWAVAPEARPRQIPGSPGSFGSR